MACSLLYEQGIEVVAKREMRSMGVDLGVSLSESRCERTRGGLMSTVKSQFFQLTWAVITFVLVVGALSMIWPAIIALFLGALLLIQSCCAEQAVVVLSWVEVSNVPVVVATLG